MTSPNGQDPLMESSLHGSLDGKKQKAKEKKAKGKKSKEKQKRKKEKKKKNEKWTSARENDPHA